MQGIKRHLVKQVYFISDRYSGESDVIQEEFKIQFPQSIRNEELEQINHPVVDIMPSLTSDDEKLQEKLNVPKFWNPSFFPDGDARKSLGDYGERPLTKEEVKKIGSHIIPAMDYDEQEPNIVEREEKGDDDKYVTIIQEQVIEMPPKIVEPLETIFVSISNYRDKRCTRTVEQIFLQAAYPERIRVAVVDQIEKDNEGCIDKRKFCSGKRSRALCEYSHQIDTYTINATLAVGPVFARHIGSRMYRGEYFAMQIDARMEFVEGKS